MSYQVLARKWRPKVFAELVGQQHVVRALSHALDGNRVHHAYLFTGTRGVGKTTIARIFAKSLNCETGITSTPCGVCSACRDIADGRFFDLLEIDAASNTGVDDVRDLIENAQYLPARGRMKVYLIDEVHMLSRAAFNALLKTLEEPPEHVKFLLATTDPQKLPVTVLSRCLQFNLRRLTVEEIGAQIVRILEAENIAFDAESVAEIAHAGNGSLRDALSVLDQAIAFGAGRLEASEVRGMLGTLDRSGVIGLLDAVVTADSAVLAERMQAVVEYQPDFGAVLDALAECLHAVQVAQLLPATRTDELWPGAAAMAARIAPEAVQLFYHLVTAGRRDLDLAPSARIGFEMCLLRLLAFQPQPTPEQRLPVPDAAPDQAADKAAPASGRGRGGEAAPRTMAVAGRGRDDSAALAASATTLAVARVAEPDVEAPVRLDPRPLDSERWARFPEQADLRGPLREFVANLGFIEDQDGLLRLALAASRQQLQNDFFHKGLRDALLRVLGRDLSLRIELVEDAIDTPATRAEAQLQQQQALADASLLQDPFVQAAIARLGARILANSSRPIESQQYEE
ncbi:MAG: DNA polymerase III subunit gamma/tau [Lysobacterales bacterium]